MTIKLLVEFANVVASPTKFPSRPLSYIVHRTVLEDVSSEQAAITTEEKGRSRVSLNSAVL
jgi:hypothetical protein